MHSMLISTPCWLAKTDSIVDGEARVLEAEFKLLRRDCKLSILFRPGARAPWESLRAGDGDQRTLRLLCRILGLMFDTLTTFCADMEPLSKYSPVMLQFSPATVILTENPGVGWWWSEILTYLFKVYVLTIFFIKISIAIYLSRHIFKWNIDKCPTPRQRFSDKFPTTRTDKITGWVDGPAWNWLSHFFSQISDWENLICTWVRETTPINVTVMSSVVL